MRFSLGDGAVYSCALNISRQYDSNQFDEATVKSATVANRIQPRAFVDMKQDVVLQMCFRNLAI